MTTPRPHHLKVVDDITVPTACGNLIRYITYQVVTANHQPIGIPISISEDFHGTVISSCKGNQVIGSACNEAGTFSDGSFVDRLSTGCATSYNAPLTCGFDIDHPSNTWQWCKPGSAPVPLADLIYRVHYDSITVIGLDKMPEGLEIYPWSR